MPAAAQRKMSVWGYPILALILFGFGYMFYKIPWLLLLVPVMAVFGWRAMVKHTRRMRACAQSRAGEDISSFVRAFDCHQTDTWILRAVYEELSKYCQIDGRPFPIHADDRWEEDLQIDSEDMDLDLLPDIAYRAGRSLEDTEKNPYYDRVKTVRDIVGFLEYQPRLQSVEQPHAPDRQ